MKYTEILTEMSDSEKKAAKAAISHIKKAIKELGKLPKADGEFYIKELNDVISSDGGEAGLINWVK